MSVSGSVCVCDCVCVCLRQSRTHSSRELLPHALSCVLHVEREQHNIELGERGEGGGELPAVAKGEGEGGVQTLPVLTG